MSNISAYEKSIAALQKAELIHAQREKTLRMALGNSSTAETAAPTQSLANATPEERLQVLRNLDQETLLALRDKTLKEALQKNHLPSPDKEEKADTAAPSETSPTARSVSEELDQKKAAAPSPDAQAEAKAETPPEKEEDVSSPKKVDKNKAEEMEEDKNPDENKTDKMEEDKVEEMEEDKPEGTRRVSTSEEPEKTAAATDAISSLLALSKQA